MMPAVPRVIAQRRPEADGLAGFRVNKNTGKLFTGHGSQQLAPAGMHSIKERQWFFDVSSARIDQRGPSSFIVGLNGWPIFGQRPLEANVTIHMAIGQMMNDLPNRPISISGIKLIAR
jgi:hypothetical protein